MAFGSKIKDRESETQVIDAPDASVREDFTVSPLDTEADSVPAEDSSGNDQIEQNEQLEQDEQAELAKLTPEVLNGTTTATRRGRPKLADLPAVSEDDLGDGEFVPEDEWDSNPIAEKQSQVRDAAQVKVDNKVKQVHEAWIKAGKPGARTSPRARYEVKPEHAAGTRAMLTRAGTFHKVRVTPVSRNLPNGLVAIVFTARDREPKPATAKK